jgi:hypothetical protein
MLRLLLLPLLAMTAVPAGHLLAPAVAQVSGLHLVLAPPWRDAEALIAAAGGRVIGPWTAPFGRFAAPDAADFRTRAAELGLLVLDGQPFGLLCRTDT